MDPKIQLNWLAIIAALAASFVIGGLWYGPLFGKAWKAGMGIPTDAKPAGMGKALALNAFGIFLMAFVMAHSVAAWHASAWGQAPDKAPQHYGFFGGFFNWLGFVIPILLNSVAFEGKKWKVFGINAAYQFVSLQAMGMILAFWR
ncbi:MAG: DUF1761 domain-containing protein [Planctomycetes bacterium]|nr:DUF1761 domain-containing protein [Planctomycetota bacterium]